MAAPPSFLTLAVVVVRPLVPAVGVAADKNQRELVALDVLGGLDEHGLVVVALGAIHRGRALQGGVVGHRGQHVVQVYAV